MKDPYVSLVLVAHLGLKDGVAFHGEVVMLMKAVCEPLEGITDTDFQGAEAFGIAFEGDF